MPGNILNKNRGSQRTLWGAITLLTIASVLVRALENFFAVCESGNAFFSAGAIHRPVTVMVFDSVESCCVYKVYSFSTSHKVFCHFSRRALALNSCFVLYSVDMGL